MAIRHDATLQSYPFPFLPFKTEEISIAPLDGRMGKRVKEISILIYASVGFSLSANIFKLLTLFDKMSGEGKEKKKIEIFLHRRK